MNSPITVYARMDVASLTLSLPLFYRLVLPWSTNAIVLESDSRATLIMRVCVSINSPSGAFNARCLEFSVTRYTTSQDRMISEFSQSSEVAKRNNVYLVADSVKNAPLSQKKHQPSLGREEPDSVRLCTNIDPDHFCQNKCVKHSHRCFLSFLMGWNPSQISIYHLEKGNAEKRRKCRDAVACFCIGDWRCRLGRTQFIWC